MTTECALLFKGFMYGVEGSTVVNISENLVLESSYWTKLFEYDFQDESLKQFFESISKDDCVMYFQFGIDCISYFVQANFTGPELPEHFEHFFNGSIFKVLDFAKLLSVDDDINVNTRYPVLLYAARCIFRNCNVDFVVNIWWQWRSILILQQVLDNLSPMLFSEVKILSEKMQTFPVLETKTELEIEMAQLYNLYRQISKAEYHMNTARKLLGMEYELIGKLGKRTKFQQTEVSQLTLSIKTKNSSNIEVEHESPQNVMLQDDVRLDSIKFTETENPIQHLSRSDQKLLLTALQLMLISQPQDNLYYEEVKPFIDLILQQNNTWVIRVVILLIRCKFEAKHKRTIERCLMQCEEIVNAIKKATPLSHHRVYDVYATSIPPIWKTEDLLGNLMLCLGLVKAALDIFLRIQNWDAVITCYALLKMPHKAAEVIQQQLNINRTVKLLCYLGDTTDDINCYEEAWILSNERSFIAQYHWGLNLYQHRKYEECISHFEKSLDINPIQPSVWLYLGYAALKTDNWEGAAAAYRYYTSLEPGSFETWNNLAKAYIRLGNKRGAHQALHDALRCNYDNWKVWDNLMGVSADIGHFSDIIQSYHRILDLKEKHLDIDALTVLVQAVTNNLNDSDSNPANHLLKKTRELLGRVTSIYPADGPLWELYANLAPDQFIKAQRLQRALKGFMNPDWEKNLDKSKHILYICRNLAEVALSDHIEATNHILNSIKLNLKSTTTVIKKFDYEETDVIIRDIEELLSKILKKIEIGQEIKS